MILLSIFTSGLFWFGVIILLIGLVIVLTNKSKSTSQEVSSPRASEVTGKSEFLDWLKPHLEAANFTSTHPTKKHLEHHIYELIMEQWRLQYVVQTGNAMLINNIQEVVDEIIKFLISKDKITYEKSAST